MKFQCKSEFKFHLSSKTKDMHFLKNNKPNPLQGWTSPDGSRRYKPPDFKTIGT
jgi:hypothetical protein